MTDKSERVIQYIVNECKNCKASDEDGECYNPKCFEAHHYAIECIRKVKEHEL